MACSRFPYIIFRDFLTRNKLKSPHRGYNNTLDIQTMKTRLLLSGYVAASLLVANISAQSQSNNGGFCCLDSGGPRVLWFSLEGYQTSASSPVITSNGTVLVRMNNYLFAFNAGHPLMQSSWPMHRHDAKRTARVVQRGLKLLGVQANGDVNLELRVEPGRPYVVQSSANTVDWSDEISLTPDTWKKQVTLLGKSGPRFFRLRTTLD